MGNSVIFQSNLLHGGAPDSPYLMLAHILPTRADNSQVWDIST